MYKRVVKPVLFLMHPDFTHLLAVKIGSVLGNFSLTRKILQWLFVYKNPVLEQEFFGIKFPNPVGLAGGFDKNCELLKTMPEIGFGFMEVGSITRFPYKGNERPWSVRLPKDQSLIVNYGLRNKGADVLSEKLQTRKTRIPLIINIAKTNDSNIKGQGTIDDYIHSYQKLEEFGDLININISCPNTGDGILLCEDTELLKGLLDGLQTSFEQSVYKKPILLKIKPDLADEKLLEILGLIKQYNYIKGFVVANLSKDRGLLKATDYAKYENIPGGISGAPIKNISTEMIRKVRRNIGEKYLIIGCGGIFSAEDAYEKIQAGANLVELITGLIYEGPSLIKNINKGLAEILKNKNQTISELCTLKQ